MLGMTLCRVARISVSVSVSYKRRSSLIYPILQFAFCNLHFALRFIAFPLAPLRLAISHFAFVVTLCAMRYAFFYVFPYALCPMLSAFFYSPCALATRSYRPDFMGCDLRSYIFILYISCAFFASSSRNFGWAISRIAFILCRIVLPAKAAIPQSVTM